MKYHLDIDIENNTSGSIILRYIKPNSRVLEFGPASGYMTRYMTERLGCQVWCVELDEEMAQIAAAYCQKMIVADIETEEWLQELDGQFFDHIIFADVLEHLREPQQALAKIRAFLGAGGTLFTSIPNVGHNAVIMQLLQDHFRYHPTGILDDTHIRFFTRESIENLLHDVRFIPIKWLGVWAEPQYTEFQEDYHAFPETVQAYLQRRPHAEVYQYITISKRLEDTTEQERKQLLPLEGKEVTNGLTNDYCQLYWEKEAAFSEELSVKTPAFYGEDSCVYELALPQPVSGRLRVDAINHPAVVRIDSIKMYETSKKEKLCLESSQDNQYAFLQPGPNMVVLDNETSGYSFLATAEDSHFFLNLPQEVVAQHFEIKMSLQKESQYLLEQTNQHLYNLKSRLQRTRQEWRNTQETLEATQTCLVSTQHRLVSTQQELYTVNKDKEYKEWQLAVIKQSRSWRLTKPLRDAGDIARKGKRILCRMRQEGVAPVWKEIWRRLVRKTGQGYNPIAAYEEWVVQQRLDHEACSRIVQEMQAFSLRPLFSIIIPVYNVEECWLRKCLDSVLAQLYPYWEVCVADDASTLSHVRSVLEEYAAKDSRIRIAFREENGHISAASNSALELATGEYIALLDNDDELTPEALFENAQLINRCPQVDFIYSDEDKITLDGKYTEPFFKPDWSPDLFRSQMYVGHLCVIRRVLVQEAGGFRLGFEGSQDYDLILRVTEKAKHIAHIPKVLYHWRKLPTSTAGGFAAKPYAHEAGLLALQEHAERLWGKGACEVQEGDFFFQYKTKFLLPEPPLVSIIIPTKDHAALLSVCIDSILEKSTYPNYEILVLNNNSEEQESFAYFERLAADAASKTRVIDAPIPFNWSKLNNLGIAQAKGDFFVFLNNDIEVISPDWLEWLIGYAARQEVGVCGPLLLYPDGTIQHAGVVMGIGGYADHIYKGMRLEQAQSSFVSPGLTRNVAAVTGACMAVAREKIEKQGGFDESFIICGSDVELCLRLHQGGLCNVYIPQVRLIHHESKSRGSRIPANDFTRSKEAYGQYLRQGDPYYNRNLSLEDTQGGFKRPS